DWSAELRRPGARRHLVRRLLKKSRNCHAERSEASRIARKSKSLGSSLRSEWQALSSSVIPRRSPLLRRDDTQNRPYHISVRQMGRVGRMGQIIFGGSHAGPLRQFKVRTEN